MEHVAMHHCSGDRLDRDRPDDTLIEYLWNKKLIDNAQKQELKQYKCLGQSPAAYTVTEGRTDSKRRTVARAVYGNDRRPGDTRRGDNQPRRGAPIGGI